MSQASSDALPTQPEDYRAILSALCKGNWVAIAGALLLEVFIRTSPAFEWPRWGNFSLSYNLVLFEFAAVTFGVTMLLRRTAWLDRAPREALDRLHHLMLAVLALDGLHLLGFLHTTGGILGPMVILVPPVILTLYLLLPRREAHSVTAILVVALLLMMVVSGGMGSASQGMLAASFLPGNETPVPWYLVVFAGLLLALMVGVAANGQMEKAGTGLGRRVNRDPDTGLFTRQVLERRVPGELGRLDRSESAAALLMISFKNMQELLSQGDYARFDQVLHEFANGLRRSTRQTSDTCARYDVSSFAALLPTASSETVSVVVDRIKQCTDKIPKDGQPGVELAIGVVSTSTASHTDPEVFFKTAQEALKEARALGGPGHQVVNRNL